MRKFFSNVKSRATVFNSRISFKFLSLTHGKQYADYKKSIYEEVEANSRQKDVKSLAELNGKMEECLKEKRLFDGIFLYGNFIRNNSEFKKKLDNRSEKAADPEEQILIENINKNKSAIIEQSKLFLVNSRINFYFSYIENYDLKSLDRWDRIYLLLVLALLAWFYWGLQFPKELYEYLFSKDKKDLKRTESLNINLDSRMGSFYNNKKTNFIIQSNVKDRLGDVKGIDEVKTEIEEVVKMMKNPKKYEDAGAKMVKGILLVGKPGTGKTLLARALAGESNINFIAISASEFDKSLVGEGGKILKDLFQQARRSQPCIIFIDEIDTLLHSGRRHGKYSSSHERSLINTFLSEMDGFNKREHIFVLGATNSEKDLDKAALRPGRFDKIIYVPLPDKNGRRDIFDLYLNKIKMPLIEINSEALSKMTPGFTGAEIENMVNTTVINAVNYDKESISKSDFEDARDRVVLGIKRKVNPKNVRSLLQLAVHEAGHTLACYKDKICSKGIHKVSIIPRGESKSKTSTLHDELEGTKEELLSMIDASLAGLIAEEIYFGKDKVSVGCGNDLNRATNLAKGMVKRYAMDSKFGYMVVEEDMMVSHKISGNTRNELDNAVLNILKNRSELIREILTNNVSELKNLTQKLVEYEELTKSEIDAIISGKDLDSDEKKKRIFSLEGMAL